MKINDLHKNRKNTPSLHNPAHGITFSFLTICNKNTPSKIFSHYYMKRLFLHKLILSAPVGGLNFIYMLRKFTLLFLLCIGLHSFVQAQTLDSVTIYMPYGTDTTCPGIQLTFTAVQSNDTFSNVQYHWYTDNTFIGVIIDTFYSTALTEGDSVFCYLVYTNSFGVLDSAISNIIIVHRSDSIPPRVLISLTTGSNPGCGATPLTFTAYPVNGGTAPTYQWMVDGTLVTGADSITFTRYFNAGDTVSCLMVSNSECAHPSDSAFSLKIPIIHDSLTASDTIVVARNPICFGTLDTFTATTYAPGSSGYSIAWYVDTASFPSAVGPVFITDSLHNNDKVYCILTDLDPCVINKTTVSNVITMNVIPLLYPSVNVTLTGGANPSCLDSPVTFTATFLNSGSGATDTWFVNGLVAATNTLTFTYTYLNGDLMSFQVETTDGGCYNADSVMSPAVLMIRDSTPVAPFISLIGNVLEGNTAGNYIWYYSGNIVPGATGQNYAPPATAIGYYYAIRDSANCPSLPSNTLYIALLEVNNINAGDVKIYPNPTSGILNLDLAQAYKGMKMDVYNSLGIGLRHEDIDNQSHFETDLSYLPDGDYFVVLKDESGSTSTFKIQIRK